MSTNFELFKIDLNLKKYKMANVVVATLYVSHQGRRCSVLNYSLRTKNNNKLLLKIQEYDSENRKK